MIIVYDDDMADDLEELEEMLDERMGDGRKIVSFALACRMLADAIPDTTDHTIH